MKEAPEALALNHARAIRAGHRQAIAEALLDLREEVLPEKLEDELSKPARRLLDQFAYGHTRLQDDMDARLLPSILLLRALGEDISAFSMLDRLELLQWLPAAEEWTRLRRIRNEFRHDYPERPEIRQKRLFLAIQASERLLQQLALLEQRINHRFPSADT